MTGTAHTQKAAHAATLPVNPFESNHYHYGMLLGVADLEAEQGYHRGKMWLHSAFLHGGGAVWGLGVEQSDPNEIIVKSGLAIDHNGRELWLNGDHCIDIRKWFDSLDQKKLKTVERDGSTVKFIAHVRLCSDQCLDRPVPSIAEPCGDSESDVAYSRTVERARPELVMGEPPSPTMLYPGLAALLDNSFKEADDAQAEAEPETSSGGDGEECKPKQERAPDDGEESPPSKSDPCAAPETCEERWHRTAVKDTIALRPTEANTAWSPIGGDGCIVLARLTIMVNETDGGWVMGGDAQIDNTVRPVHISTTMAQSLLWRALCCCEGASTDTGNDSGGKGDSRPPEEAAKPLTRQDKPRLDTTEGGFRVDPESVECDGRTIVLSFTQPAAGASVKSRAFTVSVLDAEGWRAVEIKSTGRADDGQSVTLNLSESVDGCRIRIVVRGTGEEPVISSQFAPLHGCIGDPVSTTGSDAAVMWDLSDAERPSTN